MHIAYTVHYPFTPKFVRFKVNIPTSIFVLDQSKVPLLNQKVNMPESLVRATKEKLQEIIIINVRQPST